ncbi:MAG: ERCC4 domain-containing protein [Sulfuriferula sp.]|nr:ERCC4 domain-containing protein [Sulfuriferula sp.]
MTDTTTIITYHPREAKTAVLQHWQTYPGSFKGLSTQSAELDCGDYDLGGGVVVERKSATDFTLAIMDKRLFSEVGKLKSSYDQPIYIVEGDIYGGRFHTDPIVIREAISWLTVMQGVPLVPSPGEGFTAEILFTMASQAQHGLGHPIVMRSGKPFDPVNGQRYLVEGLPGINEAMAKLLLDHFGSAAAVFAAEVDALAQVPGITPQAAARMRKVLDAKWPGARG